MLEKTYNILMITRKTTQIMKYQIKVAASFLVAVLAMLSCEKNTLTTNTLSKKQSALSDFFKNIAPPMQHFTISAGQGQLVRGQKGTQIIFFFNSFKKKDGTILTSGNVKVVLQEMLTGPEMILANKTTTSDGKLLVSGGQIYINAYLGNDELLINQADNPLVYIPAKTPDNMSLFKGNIKENDYLKGDTVINWVADSTPVRRRQDTFGIVYNFPLDSFRYINCDYFYNQSASLTDIKVTIPSGFADTSVALFVYFPSINSVARAHSFNSITRSFSLGDFNKVPAGLSVKFLFVGKKGSQFYYEIKSATISNNYTTTLTPVLSTESAIKAAIKSM
jgi:hypothetical protein